VSVVTSCVAIYADELFSRNTSGVKSRLRATFKNLFSSTKEEERRMPRVMVIT